MSDSGHEFVFKNNSINIEYLLEAQQESKKTIVQVVPPEPAVQLQKTISNSNKSTQKNLPSSINKSLM